MRQAFLNARTFASLRRHRNYRLYFVGQIVSLSGTWMQNVALAWLIVELTHSPVAVGFLAFVRFAPFALFSLPAGVLADRLDNRRVMMVTQAVSMVVSVVLAGLRPHREPRRSGPSTSSRCSGERVPVVDAPTAMRSPSSSSAGTNCRTQSRSTRASSTPRASSAPRSAAS